METGLKEELYSAEEKERRRRENKVGGGNGDPSALDGALLGKFKSCNRYSFVFTF